MVKLSAMGYLSTRYPHDHLLNTHTHTHTHMITVHANSLLKAFSDTENRKISNTKQQVGSKKRRVESYYRILNHCQNFVLANWPKNHSTTNWDRAPGRERENELKYFELFFPKCRDFKLWWCTFQKNKHSENLKVKIILSTDFIVKNITNF